MADNVITGRILCVFLPWHYQPLLRRKIMGLTSRSRENYSVNKGVYSDTHPVCKNPCLLPIASHWHYTTILNSEINFHLLYNMYASVPADFCRPTGLESARPRPGIYSLWNHQGYHKLSVYRKIQYYSQCGKTICVTSSDDTLTLTVSKHSSHWRL